MIGAGSWGTAVANYIGYHKEQIRLWVREAELCDYIRKNHQNYLFLPDTILSDRLIPDTNLKNTIQSSDTVFLAVPSKYLRAVLHEIKDELKNKSIINLSKGIESQSLKTISQLAIEICGPEIAANWVTLSGPSFAKELAMNHPTAIVGASKNPDLLKQVQDKFSSEILRIYRTTDLTGIEVGGSVKNVIAIASGMLSGLGYGYNTRASLITRASVEISRFGVKIGAKPETFWGLAGIGDLMLTCFGPISRNFQLGERIARGETLEEIEKSTSMVAEGVETTKALVLLIEKLQVEMPICREVHNILFNGEKPANALKKLMIRSLKIE
jgi:glycerol-3-phosphate dehydrogenase (NAD(P)+)